MPAIPFTALRRVAARNRDELLLGLALGVKGFVMLCSAGEAAPASRANDARVSAVVAERPMHQRHVQLVRRHHDAALSSEIEGVLDGAMAEAFPAHHASTHEAARAHAAARREAARAQAEVARARAKAARERARLVRVTVQRDREGRIEIVRVLPKGTTITALGGGGEDVLDAAIDHGLERAFPLPPARRSIGNSPIASEPPSDA